MSFGHRTGDVFADMRRDMDRSREDSDLFWREHRVRMDETFGRIDADEARRARRRIEDDRRSIESRRAFDDRMERFRHDMDRRFGRR